MASTTQKGSKKSKAKLRGSVVKTSAVEQAQTIAELRQQLAESLQREHHATELQEALEQQTATSEILGVIASSPTEIQPVLDTIAQSAARVCGSDDATIRLIEGDTVSLVAHYGTISPGAGAGHCRGTRPAPRPCYSGEQSTFRTCWRRQRGSRIADRSAIRAIRVDPNISSVPMLREGNSIGVINIRRTKVRPFSERQIKLLETFAAQAVIAIENVRLFKELQERNAELREALEHQTATAEVLGIISRSPTDVQPVLDAIVESAARVCGIDDVQLRLHEGDNMVSRAHFGPIPSGRFEISIDAPQFRWTREHGTLHIPDVRTQRNDFPTLGSDSGSRTFLTIPLRHKEEFIGTLAARRGEVRPFTQVQIKLLETFADQAVIAIENVRLFQELKESLEQQTATSEILGVIASSPTDIQPVLDAVAESAARLCGASDANIRLREGDGLRSVANYGPLPSIAVFSVSRGSATGRAVVDRRTVHIDDLAAESDDEFPEGKRSP